MKMEKLSQEVENIREGIEQLELLTEPIFDEDQLKI
jgi:hypothetical protein